MKICTVKWVKAEGGPDHTVSFFAVESGVGRTWRRNSYVVILFYRKFGCLSVGVRCNIEVKRYVPTTDILDKLL